MPRILPLLLTVVVVATACGGRSTEPETVPGPSRVVVRWLEAVENADAPAISASVLEDTVAIVLAVENGLTAAQTAGLLRDGIPAPIAAEYWRSFRDEFAAFAGRPISTLTVGEERELDAGGYRYAAVQVRGSGGAESVVMARRDPDTGVWRIDLVATLGSGFVTPLRRAFEALPDDDAGRYVADAYRQAVAPGLWAALGSGGFDEDFAREALRFVEEIDPSS